MWDFTIIIDWNCTGRVSEVGSAVSSLLAILHTVKDQAMGRVHVLGHGLGAHVAGFAGKNLKAGRIGRITG